MPGRKTSPLLQAKTVTPITWGGSSSEKLSRGSEKVIERKRSWVGKRHFWPEAQRPRGEQSGGLRSEYVTSQNIKTGRNLSPLTSPASRIVSPFGVAHRVGKRHFRDPRVGRSEFVTVRGKSAGRNLSPLTTVASGREMSPLDSRWVGNRHHMLSWLLSFRQFAESTGSDNVTDRMASASRSESVTHPQSVVSVFAEGPTEGECSTDPAVEEYGEPRGRYDAHRF